MLYKNVLIIDDDIDDIEIFIEAINFINKDIICRTYNSPVIALKKLENLEEFPDLIFLDYNMPVLNGIDFLHKIKNNERLKYLPIILISSPSEEFMRHLLKKNDIFQYISKPSSFSELISALEHIL